MRLYRDRNRLVDKLYSVSIEILEVTDNINEIKELEGLMNELNEEDESNLYKIRSIISFMVDITKHFR